MKRNIVIATLTAAALATGGTVAAFAAGDDETAAQRQSSSGTQVVVDHDDRDDANDADDRADDVNDVNDDVEDRTTVATGDVSAAEAIAAALKSVPGTAVSADLDDQDDNGKVVWGVDVLGDGNTWHSVTIDPATGKVLGSHTEREDDTAQVRAALKGASVTAAQAAEAAAAKGTVTSVDLDDDGASQAWDVETRGSTSQADQDWQVDLNSGKVTADRSDGDED
ncbi:PepSY domain-containing protein [Streptomyces sp. S3(2020)]|uniref:PepSY domain-containing protein n=1 Tax=Streptomyces sp. S3(2020) TaxID=2732044 RepID=UPI00148842CA|nr:PepSY domain-containing protein [Streptomyces sp. S3(2020)]NNN35734.1 PepSY domain-containing protein [Streptomyces sp. S3(2020)]